MKKILFFTGFVGGRGSSKAIRWLYDGLLEKGIKPIIVTESLYQYKLNDIALKPDFIITRSSNDPDTLIYNKVKKQLSKIDFDLMVSFSPRTYGPYYAFQNKIPYIISEYGYPFSNESFPNRCIGEVNINASAYLILAPFALKLDLSKNMKNVKIVAQPYSKKRFEYIQKVRMLSQNDARKLLYKQYPELLKYQYDLFVNLTINDEYISPFNVFPNNQNYIDTWGNAQNGYLSPKAQEQCMGFVNRLIAGLETQYKGKVLIYMINKVQSYCLPTLQQCKKVKAFSRPSPFVDLDTDLLLKKAADINICRESIGDNTCELYAIGKPFITTVVPTNFMNEESGLNQAIKRNTSFSIEYNDPQYIQKLIEFINKKKLQKKIMYKQLALTDKFIKTNNYYKTIENLF